MIRFEVGKTMPTNYPDTEGGRLVFLGGVLLFVVGLWKPSIREVNSMRDSGLSVGVVEYERLGVLLLEYEGGLTFEPTFDVGIEKGENIPEYRFTRADERIPVSIVGYDLESRKAFSIRYCSMSPRVSRVFAEIISRQKSARIERAENYVRVNTLYSRVSSFDEMKALAIAIDPVGQ